MFVSFTIDKYDFNKEIFVFSRIFLAKFLKKFFIEFRFVLIVQNMLIEIDNVWSVVKHFVYDLHILHMWIENLICPILTAIVI